MADAASAPAPWRVILLSCRDPNTDFRRALADELHELGHRVHYVHLSGRPTVHTIGEGGPAAFSLPKFVLWMLWQTRRGRVLVFNSTNLAFPRFIQGLKLLCGGSWCFDMHDDLLYDKEGADLDAAVGAQRTLLKASDLIVHAAPTLAELFPSSHHLGNASHVGPTERPGPFAADRILILASLDQRFDFAFFERTVALNPGIEFSIYGRISENSKLAAVTQGELETVLARYPNVTYFGSYTNADLARLLSSFSVTFAPYKMNNRLTRYLDPLRYYHCLNAGLELITTPIPSIDPLISRLHLITEPEAFGPLVSALGKQATAKRNGQAGEHQITWRSRAEKLVAIAERHGR